MGNFFAIDNNTMINIDAVDSVEQVYISEGIPVVYAYVGGKQYEIKRDIEKFLETIKNIGATTTFWAG